MRHPQSDATLGSMREVRRPTPTRRPLVFGFTATGIVLGLWLLLGASGTAFSQGKACDLSRRQREVFDMLRIGMPLHQTQATLTEALACPNADLDFELNYYQILVALMRADCPTALKAARRAERAAAGAGTDLDRERASRLKQLTKENLHRVTFTRPDGSGQGAEVRIVGMEGLELPRREEVKALLPRPLAVLADRLFKELLKSAGQTVESAKSTPFSVCLPTGQYELSTGQWVPVDGDVTIPVIDIRARPHTIAALELMTLRPLQSDRLDTSFEAGVGLVLSHRVRWRRSLLLGVTLGIVPVRFGEAGGAEESGDTGEADQVASTAELGAINAEAVKAGMSGASFLARTAIHLDAGPVAMVMLSRNLPMMLGVNLGVLSLPAGLVLNDLEGAEGDAQILAAGRPFVAPYLKPEFNLLYQITQRSGMEGYFMSGISLGITGGRFVGEQGGTLGLTASQRISLFPALQVGGSLLF